MLYSFMNEISRKVIIILMLCGCSLVPIRDSEYHLPNQDINASTDQDKYRIIFFNTSNIYLYPLSGTINVRIDQKHVATLKIGQYVQVNLSPGEYDLYLDHWDAGTWASEYKFTVQKELPGDPSKRDVFVKVFAQITSTDLEVVNKLPEDFMIHYRPAYKK